jgi:hypothetical protein
MLHVRHISSDKTTVRLSQKFKNNNKLFQHRAVIPARHSAQRGLATPEPRWYFNH